MPGPQIVMGTIRVGVTLNKAVMYICDALLVVSHYCVTSVGRRKGAYGTPNAGSTLQALLPGRRGWALTPSDVRQSHTMKLQGYPWVPRVNNVVQQTVDNTAHNQLRLHSSPEQKSRTARCNFLPVS